MSIKRIARHLVQHHWRAKQVFPQAVLDRIEQAIRSSEATHSGQVRFVVEGALDGRPLFRDQPARERALDVFSHLRIWDTAHNNGVLIYLLLADHRIEIVADRGLNALVPQTQWAEVAARMAQAFAKNQFAEGLSAAVDEVHALLAAHFPASPGAPNPNELPDTVVLI